MGKRTYRLNGSALPPKAQSLLGKEAHIVMWNGKTRFGTITNVGADTVTVKDKNALWYNRKKHTHTIALIEIRELIYNEISSW